MGKIAENLGHLVAKQKLVPFMGAGCSAAMLPDWDTLINEMSKELGSTVTGNNLEIAQKYVDTFGKEKFCEFLKNNLWITDFDDDKGYVHLTVMNMGVTSIYTTNQDNVMEKVYEKYGKQHRALIKYEDFSGIKLSEQLYIKFHGDLNYPETVVFTQEDYDKRMNEPLNPLNIRLQSDLIAKGLLFIGYSFRDINIQQMFCALQKALGGKLPESYMIAYKYNDELQKICDEYGIILIDPMKEFPESENHDAAFELFLNAIMEESRIKQVDNEIKEFFTAKKPRTIRVVNKQEVTLLENAIKTESFFTCIQLFRKICDVSIIPSDYEKRIVDIYIELCKLAKTDKDTEALNSAIFNLKLEEPLNKMTILAALMATANIRTPQNQYGEDMFYIADIYVRKETYTVISAKALEYVYSWGLKPTKTLSWNVGHWIDRGAFFDLLPEDIRKYISHWIDKMRSDCKTVAEHPIKRQQRLLASSTSPSSLRSDEINVLRELINQEC